MKIKKIICIVLTFLVCIISISCEWPFNTAPSEDEIFKLTVNHNISRIMPSAEIDLTWNELTVENFAMYKIERIRTQDTAWTSIIDLTDAFQLSYIDTIFDDDDLIYRIGIFDLDDNVRWATASISIPKTTLILIPDEFKTIQPAFDSELMDDGDTILVKVGIYPETLRIAGKDVLIKSIAGYQSTILMPTYSEDPTKQQRVLNISSGIVDGFTVEHGAPSFGASGGGIVIAQTGTVQNCYIAGNASQGVGGGVFLVNDGNLYNNIIFNNIAGTGSGIYISSAHGEIINNTIVGNDIFINGDCSGLILRNNIIYNSSPDIDILFSSPTDTSGIIIDYLLLDSDIGIGTDIIIADPMFDNFIDFKLSPSSPCIDAGHPDAQYLDRDGSRNDIGAYGGPGSRL